ncbi:hybrid sensor histidine kinase/response regulato r [Desulfonema ishimotonii]|uniref:histidine kinase n=1 Tax=Desulfonema ishimotonii TaxID=45657 RepID=A0A401FVQ3_9BACT|nr:hybrid sensor histidine kinase/response regulator [Desulfonema ishimotonii]GBC61038.1 hybrid sensor histidine kinase/response regulato r [Desulfonema ishimotonii]
MRGEKKQTILVVDDERYNINILVDILKSDYRTIVAKSGKEALRRVNAETPPALILLDIMMPEMDGYEVCRRLKENPATCGIPVIFITAMTDIANEARGFEVGAIDYIVKPVSPPIVRARVKNHLALTGAREEIEAQKHQLEIQNEALVEAARLRENVDRLTRHDLKTPLNAIIGFSQLIASDNNLAENQKDALKVIEEAGYRILNIVNLSVDLLRMERGAYRFRPVPVDIVKVIRKITCETGALISSKNISVKMTIAGEPAGDAGSFPLMGEELLCYTMLVNLIKNALEASPRDGELGISLEEEERAAVIRICNAGVVPEEIRENFFDMYVTAGKRRGAGLGTYSARLMAETQKGSIHMRSSESEGTTTLTIRLPRQGICNADNPAAPENAEHH